MSQHIPGRIIGHIDPIEGAHSIALMIATDGVTFEVGNEVDVYLGHEERLTEAEWQRAGKPQAPADAQVLVPPHLYAEIEAELAMPTGAATGLLARVREYLRPEECGCREAVWTCGYGEAWWQYRRKPDGEHMGSSPGQPCAVCGRIMPPPPEGYVPASGERLTRGDWAAEYLRDLREEWTLAAGRAGERVRISLRRDGFTVARADNGGILSVADDPLDALRLVSRRTPDFAAMGADERRAWLRERGRLCVLDAIGGQIEARLLVARSFGGLIAEVAAADETAAILALCERVAALEAGGEDE